VAAVLLVLGVAAGTCGAEVYRWTDANGQVHFGDKPSGPGAEAVAVKPSPTPAAAPAEASDSARRKRTQRLLDEYAAERAEREEARAAAAAARAERRRRCAEARAEVAELEQSAYIYTRDETGRKVILPDSQLRREREGGRAEVRELCRGDAVAPPTR
jgi:hypothetical protein